ncbi:hypothetical protein BHE74_00000533 [Ensete ventricosum]|nr:hypothetical protein BHE74_00000533 [Ensete ventricosum]
MLTVTDLDPSINNGGGGGRGDGRVLLYDADFISGAGNEIGTVGKGNETYSEEVGGVVVDLVDHVMRVREVRDFGRRLRHSIAYSLLESYRIMEWSVCEDGVPEKIRASTSHATSLACRRHHCLRKIPTREVEESIAMASESVADRNAVFKKLKSKSENKVITPSNLFFALLLFAGLVYVRG